MEGLALGGLKGAILLGFVLVFSAASIPASVGDRATVAVEYTSHPFILIDGDASFASKAASEGWSGDGTVSNPYIIEGLSIDGSNLHKPVCIGNTTVHFVMRDCYLFNATEACILLYNVQNGTISNNTCSGGAQGEGSPRLITLLYSSFDLISNNSCFLGEYNIFLNHCRNITVADNLCTYGYYSNIYSGYSHNITLRNNECSDAWRGMYLYDFDYGTISGNDCSNSSEEAAIVLIDSERTRVESNSACNNQYAGIYIYTSSQNVNHNVVINNTCSDNRLGIVMSYSSSAFNWTMRDNTVISNSDAGLVVEGYEHDISGNVLKLCGVGMSLSCRDSLITDNLFYGSRSYAITCSGSRNLIWNNSFDWNNGATRTYNSSHIQANCTGVSKWNLTDPGIGNYWSDWDSTSPYVVTPLNNRTDFFPQVGDSDDDGMPDGYEDTYGLDKLDPSDASTSLDEDGLSNLEEYQNCTDPSEADLDSDQLTDDEELAHWTDWTNPDTDGDYIPDGWEVKYGMDPNDGTDYASDSDGDGLTSFEEYTHGTHPNLADSDSDGMADGWEIDFLLDPVDESDGVLDFDDDGLRNSEEYLAGSDPWLWDTDSDLLSDAVELVFSQTDPADIDTDGDGVTDGLEFIAEGGYSAVMEVVSDDMIGFEIMWSTYTISVKTNSSILAVSFDKDQKVLTVGVDGVNGTKGFCEISIPKSLIESPSNLSVALDGEPLNFTLYQNQTHYTMRLDYNHSSHSIVSDFAYVVPSDGPDDDDEPENGYPSWVWIAVGLAGAVIVVAAALVLYSRQRKRGGSQGEPGG